MKKFFRLVNFIIIIIVLHGGNFLQAMNEERQKYVEQAQEADCYNRNHPLFLLPKEILNHISLSCLSLKKDQQESLIASIKNLMRLSLVCKKYTDLLPFKTIGDLCKSYAQEDKDNVFEELGGFIGFCTYDILRVPLLILLCAGADSKLKFGCGPLLFYYAVEKSDEQLVRQLFECKADPNEVEGGNLYNEPIFFYVKKIEILKLFVAQENFNIHATVGHDINNVLWYVAVGDDYSAELIKFYLDHGVDAQQCISNGCCLLHKLTWCYNVNNMNEHLKKVTIFLDAIPDMINVVQYLGQTPLDSAEFFLAEVISFDMKVPVGYEKLIELYKQHGALTGECINKC